MKKYRISEDAGRVTFITAKSRTEAITKFITETGMPMWYFKKHCLVKLER